MKNRASLSGLASMLMPPQPIVYKLSVFDTKNGIVSSDINIKDLNIMQIFHELSTLSPNSIVDKYLFLGTQCD